MSSLADMHAKIGYMTYDCHSFQPIPTEIKLMARAGKSNLSGLHLDALARRPIDIKIPDTPEMKALIECEAELDRQYDAAWSAYHRHKDSARYRKELAEIEKQAEAQK